MSEEINKYPVVEVLQLQLDCAMQIIAALFLTEEEGDSICEETVSKPDPEWITSMRNQITNNKSYRKELVDILKKNEFLCNTHPGFPFGPLNTPITGYKMTEALTYLDSLVEEYRKESLPFEFSFEDALKLKGFDEETVKWLMAQVRWKLSGIRLDLISADHRKVYKQ